ncbi:MAG: OB-fold nucleic acid binding domain-containing protein, partial [Longimicrobiales bacterium]
MEPVDIRDLHHHVGQSAAVRGWVQTTRTHGKVAFVVMRDGSGLLQCVIVQKQVSPEVWAAIAGLTQETTILVSGEVRAEP